MIVSIHQPTFLPWLGFFEKIKVSDKFVFLDTVQFEKNSFDNRNRFLSRNGLEWITVPVKTSGRFGSNPLLDVVIDDSRRWRAKAARSLEEWYGKCPYFQEAADLVLTELLDLSNDSLGELNLKILHRVIEYLDLNTRLIRASELCVGGAKSDLVANIVEAVGGREYFSGCNGANYLNIEDFNRRGISVTFQNYVPRQYPQRTKDFISHLSIFDPLANNGRMTRSVI